MKRSSTKRRPSEAFSIVRRVGLGLPNVEATTKYDGSPVLKLGGCFMAGLATHRSAEPDTLVVRVNVEAREWLLEDAPETYYMTDYYRNYPDRAGAPVANQSGRTSRLANGVMAPDRGESKDTPPTPRSAPTTLTGSPFGAFFDRSMTGL
jgi:hypothetical protein